MKKNFFKKLSFVLALAMIVSMISPAAGAFAESKQALNSTKKYLLLGEDGKNVFDFNIKNKVSGSSYEWSSSDENVATVDGSGVTTAVSTGTAKVTVEITKKGAKTVTLTADVIVKDNIASLDSIYMQTKDAPALDKLKVATSYDFGRTFTTKSGSTTKTTAITKWFVNSDKATIDKMGVFSATEPGDYTITAMAFQSGAKYTAWAALNDKTATTNVLATKTLEVTVVPSVVKTAQVDADTFTVTFDSDMSKTDIVTASAVKQIINGKEVSTGAEKIKAVTLDSTGKVATVDMYAALSAGTKYNFIYKDLVGEFTAATKSLDNVTGIVFADFNVDTSSSADMLASVKAVNADGVVIYDGSVAADKAVLASYVTFAYTGDLTKGFVSANSAYIYVKGYIAPVTATFTYTAYSDTTKTYVTKTFTDSAVATGVTTDSSVNTSSLKFEVVSGTTVPTSTTWTGNLTLAAGDDGYYIHNSYVTNADATTTLYDTAYTYASSDTSKLLIQGTSVYPISAGTVSVLVKDATGAVISTFDVTVAAARTFATATQSTTSVTVGNNATYGETADVYFTAKDSMNTVLVPSVVTTIVNAPNGADTSKVVVTPSYNTDTTSADYGKVTVAVSAKGAAVGAYNVKAAVTALGTTKEMYFTVIVGDSTSADKLTVANWKVELSSTSVDLYANYDADVTVSVNGYNAAGYKVDALDASDFTFSVLNGSSTVVSGVTGGSIAVVTGVSGAAVKANYAVGTYSVTAALTSAGLTHFTGTSRVAGSYVGAASFSVVDTTALTKKLDTAALTAGTVFDAAKAAYTYYLNGTALDEVQVTAVQYSLGNGLKTATSTDTVATGDELYIASVTLTKTGSNGAKISYTYTIGNTFKIQ